MPTRSQVAGSDRPRQLGASRALRLETMALMSDVDLPVAHVRAHVASAIDLVVHTARLRDVGGSVFQIAGVNDLDGAGEPVVIEVLGQRDHSR